MKGNNKRTVLDLVVNQELSGDESGGHDHPRAQTSEEPAEARLLRKHAQAVWHRALGAVALVDLREERVRGL